MNTKGTLPPKPPRRNVAGAPAPRRRPVQRRASSRRAIVGLFALALLALAAGLTAGRCAGTPHTAAPAAYTSPYDWEGLERTGDRLAYYENGELRSMHCGVQCKTSACVFEYIYFARPDSVIDGASVELARQEAGKYLSIEHPVGADVVIGVPDSGIPAAIGYAKFSGIPYGVGLIKNRYIARTFIQPGQDKRERSVRLKLNALRTAVEGKRVIMVDDSIVRGTTCARLVKLLRDAGAAEVHMRISAPPFRHPCFFGTDIPERSQLLAHGRTVEEMREIIGVDSLGFLSLEAARKIAVGCKLGFCDACFSGNYPIPVPEQAEKNMFENEIPLPTE